MEPLPNEELDRLLACGEPEMAPPASFDRRVMEAVRARGIAWIWHSSIRVPVPALVAVVLLLGLLALFRAPRTREVQVTLDEFRPVERMEVKVVRITNENR